MCIRDRNCLLERIYIGMFHQSPQNVARVPTGASSLNTLPQVTWVRLAGYKPAIFLCTGRCITPLGRFYTFDISTEGILPASKKGRRRRRKTSLRELSEDVSFGIGNLLGCRAIEKTAPEGCYIHRRMWHSSICAAGTQVRAYRCYGRYWGCTLPAHT